MTADDLFWSLQAILIIAKDIGMSDLTWLETFTPLLCYLLMWVFVIFVRVIEYIYNSAKNRW